MISTIGRIPSCAAPSAAPRIALSAIGVSKTRALAELPLEPRVIPKTPPGMRDVLTEDDHLRVLARARAGAPR